MMRYFFSFFMIFFILVKISSNSIALENKILFKVNNEIITSLDVLTEIKYLGLINNDFNKLDKSRNFEIAKKSLLREKIKKIELIRFLKKIQIKDETLDNVILSYFSKIGINSIKEFNNFFTKEEIDPITIKQKIAVEILWNQMIYQKFNKLRMNINDLIF